MDNLLRRLNPVKGKQVTMRILYALIIMLIPTISLSDDSDKYRPSVETQTNDLSRDSVLIQRPPIKVDDTSDWDEQRQLNQRLERLERDRKSR